MNIDVLISNSPDLRKLLDQGYEIEIRSEHLLVHIPYVNSGRKIANGTLVTPLGDLSGDRTVKPKDHVMHFIGELPCDKNGNQIKGIQNASTTKILAEGIEINRTFSSKPEGGYKDYYEKVVGYVRIISSHATSLDNTVVICPYKAVDLTNDSENIFNYWDTNSTRAGIANIGIKLSKLKIAIIGTGGTGAYVLDFVSKTRVREIHIFDDDIFLSHNAFRTPGAASIEELSTQEKKVDYLKGRYAKMHKVIHAHDYNLTSENVEKLADMDFVFICIDTSDDKKTIIEKLIEKRIPFVDTGIGINAVDDKLLGSVRVTSFDKKKSEHIEKYVSYAQDFGGEYEQNIQIAEINALAAALSVMKWKKLFGFYHDNYKECNMVYDISGNVLINDEISS